ncbi:pyrophosphatase [Candidatus Campbellbacteria bacterium]|nr:MAG: pyrophosphatase [Candidatus Campbellbacteria bacterium]
MMDRDYAPFKLTDEWGECVQVYLMLTKRGRQKGKTEEEIQEMLREKIADVFGYLLLFAEQENIDLSDALKKNGLLTLRNNTHQ